MSEVVRPPVQRDESFVPARSIDDAPQVHLGGLARPKRLRKRFMVPERVRSRDTDPKTIVIQELNVGEVDAARKLSDGDRTRSLTEQVKLALYEVDGRIVDHTRDEGTFFFDGWSQKVRELAILGYDAVASNKAEDVDSFLSSMESV